MTGKKYERNFAMDAHNKWERLKPFWDRSIDSEKVDLDKIDMSILDEKNSGIQAVGEKETIFQTKKNVFAL